MARSEINELADILGGTSIVESGVSFEGKRLKLDRAEEWDEVVNAIKNCEKLEFLNLEGNTVGVEAAEAISKALATKPELKRVLWKDMFTGRNKTEIPKALLHLSKGLTAAGARLTELDMSDNAFGPIGLGGLAVILGSSICFELQQLKLNNNGLGISGGKMLSQALLSCHQKSLQEGKPLALRVFIAGRNRLENEGATALAKVFKTIGTIEEVVMPQNGINSPGIKALSESFVKNPGLRVINLNDNTLGKLGAVSIAEALPHLQKLKILNVGDCLLKTAGAVIIGEALAKGHLELEELYMGYNEIKSSGGMAVIKAMENKTKLKHLSLNGNQFSQDCCKSLKDMMKSYNKSCLDSLSENEDDDDDGDDDDDEEEEGSNEEENGEDSEKSFDNSQTCDDSNSTENLDQKPAEKVDEKPNSTQNIATGDSSMTNLHKFLSCPTEDNFTGIDSKLITNYLQLMENSSSEFYLDVLIPLVIKISSLSCSSQGNLKAVTTDIANDLYQKLFSWAKDENKVATVNNALMPYLGLIKSEDKNFKVIWNVESSRSALKNAISQGIVPESTEHILNCCLSRAKKV